MVESALVKVLSPLLKRRACAGGPGREGLLCRSSLVMGSLSRAPSDGAVPRRMRGDAAAACAGRACPCAGSAVGLGSVGAPRGQPTLQWDVGRGFWVCSAVGPCTALGPSGSDRCPPRGLTSSRSLCHGSVSQEIDPFATSPVSFFLLNGVTLLFPGLSNRFLYNHYSALLKSDRSRSLLFPVINFP